MTDWVTVASLATAAGTLVLAVATFASVRTANRAAQVAERALLVGMRPVLMPSRLSDEPQKFLWGDRRLTHVAGGRGLAEDHDGGQRMISRFMLSPTGPDGPDWLCGVNRHWNLDRADPAERAGRRPPQRSTRARYRSGTRSA